MISNSTWQGILQTANDLSTVCEIYDADYTPTSSGFDPGDAIGLYAAVAGIEFWGQSYDRLVSSFGSISRKITKEANTASVTFSNTNRAISRFEFNNGFEGLLMVIRLISRSQSTTLSSSQILFAGRCDKPTSGTKDSLTVSAKWILGGPEVQIPRRKYTATDQDGRVESDPDFEGFPFIPQYGTVSYSVREKRGGILGLFGFKKTVQKTLQYSSFSDLDANADVPEVLGTVQLLGTHIAYEDVGSNIRIRTAFCEGPIADISNAYSTNSQFPLSATNYLETLGLEGAANNIAPTWPGPGNYSRTALITGQCDNSAVDVNDAAPDIAAIISGRLMTVPDSLGAWTDDDEFTDNGAAHARWLLTDENYFDIDPAWLEDTDFTETFNYNAEQIVMRSSGDFTFLVQG